MMQKFWPLILNHFSTKVVLTPNLNQHVLYLLASLSTSRKLKDTPAPTQNIFEVSGKNCENRQVHRKFWKQSIYNNQQGVFNA